jgi:hypothetical protein
MTDQTEIIISEAETTFKIARFIKDELGLPDNFLARAFKTLLDTSPRAKIGRGYNLNVHI